MLFPQVAKCILFIPIKFEVDKTIILYFLGRFSEILSWTAT